MEDMPFEKVHNYKYLRVDLIKGQIATRKLVVEQQQEIGVISHWYLCLGQIYY